MVCQPLTVSSELHTYAIRYLLIFLFRRAFLYSLTLSVSLHRPFFPNFILKIPDSNLCLKRSLADLCIWKLNHSTSILMAIFLMNPS